MAVDLEWAVAVGQNRILLKFSGAVAQVDPLEEDDALYPGNYSLSAPGGVTLEVTRVAPGESDDEVELLTMPELPESQTITVVVAPMFGYYFSTAEFTAPQKTRTRGRDRRRMGAGLSGSDGSGDLLTPTNPQNLKTRINHRLLTSPGTLTHEPEYGFGLERFKARNFTGQLQFELGSGIKRQVLAEHDVRDARVTLIKQGKVLEIRIYVETDIGREELDFAFDWER